MATQAKKLVLVLTISVLVTDTKIEVQKVILKQIFYIYYPVQFQNNKKAPIQALINLNNKINAMTLASTKQPSFQIRKTDVRVLKIDNSLLKTPKMVIAAFQVIDKLCKARFFKKNNLLANTIMELKLEMPFFTFSNADIQFIEKLHV